MSFPQQFPPQQQGPFNPYAQPQFQQPQFPPQPQFQPPQFPPQDMFGPPPGAMMGMPPGVAMPAGGSIRQHESGGFADDSNGNLNSGGGIFTLKNAVIATVLTGGGLLFAKWMGWIGGNSEEADKAGGSRTEETDVPDDGSEVGGTRKTGEEEEEYTRRDSSATQTQRQQRQEQQHQENDSRVSQEIDDELDEAEVRFHAHQQQYHQHAPSTTPLEAHQQQQVPSSQTESGQL